jgi:two-component system sensor histidine kinase AlgZ
MKKLGKILALGFAIALFVVILIAGFMSNPRLEFLLVPFAVSMTYSTVIGGLSWWLLPRYAPRFHHSPLLRWVQLVLLLTAISLAGGSLAFGLMIAQPFVRLGLEYRPSMLICWIITMVIGGISYVVEHARYKLQASTLELRTRELEREKALQAATDAKLRSLESRIHPHFLFNTLNSISSLVRTNPTEAETTIERLAALLRFSLDRHGSLVSLADELQITRDYLDIEKTRFGERLRFRIEVPAELLNAQVPAMSIQTLAENSVKYAVGTQRTGADIVVRAATIGDSIELTVSDTGSGFSLDSLPLGHGLDTLKQRLATFFGERTSLDIRPLPQGMEVAFRVPC